MGFVEIAGKVDLYQYWPDGSSDVDTLQFVPDLATATYHSDAAPKSVRAFFENGGSFLEDEDKPGQKKFRSILRSAFGSKFLSIRLQGIDAPETHYSPNFREGMFEGHFAQWLAKHNVRQKSYRQPYGKLCTDKFATGIRERLGVTAPDPNRPEALVDAKVKILADSINGAADVYGRVVGYVTVSANGQDIVLNDDALANGFAFCSFYGSMALAEIQRLSALFASHGTGGARPSSLRKNISRQLRDFEPELWTTRSMRDTDRDDNGGEFASKCFDPKIFRRCIDWVGRREALNETTMLLDYMRTNTEEVARLSDFIAAGGNWDTAQKVTMGSLVGQDGVLGYKPGEVVFEARPIEIVDAQRNPLPNHFSLPFP